MTATNLRAQTSARWARACWAASEPFTITMFFTPEAASITEQAGLPSRAAYVLLRTAPLGAVPPAVAAATFRSFPAPVFAVLPEAWQHLSPAEAIDAHYEAVQRAATRQLGEDPAELNDMADLLAGVVRDLDTSGRVLAAANQAVAAPTEPWARLWRALNTLREHRGDGHIAALIATDLAVHDSEVLMAAWAGAHTNTPALRASRAINDQSWRAATERLAARGLLDNTGVLTAEGKALRDQAEWVTDQAAAEPWQRIGQERIGARPPIPHGTLNHPDRHRADECRDPRRRALATAHPPRRFTHHDTTRHRRPAAVTTATG